MNRELSDTDIFYAAPYMFAIRTSLFPLPLYFGKKKNTNKIKK